MSGIVDLEEILAQLSVSRGGPHVFITTAQVPAGARPFAQINEAEGITLVLPLDNAEELGLAAGQPVFELLTLQVHSSLEAVGLTAAFAAKLAEVQVSCNVLAGFYHDHILVPQAAAQTALDALNALK